MKRSVEFPPVDTSATPDLDRITGATAVDDDNPTLVFTATPIHQGPNATTRSKRLGIKLHLTSGGAGGGGPLDGLLTITLKATDSSGNPIEFKPIDVPVEYIDDPTAPNGP